PAGHVRAAAAEMIVAFGAGPPAADVLAAPAAVGQTVSIPAGGTVGGALAVGNSDVTRLGHGPIRDVLLQTHYVSSAGKVVKAGGATVKNVSGFDLCRLLVGSRGTLGFLGDVILRTRPLAPTSRWYRSATDPFELLSEVYRPVSILWNGAETWIRLDGDDADIESVAASFGLAAVTDVPVLPTPHRWSLPPSRLAELRDHEPGSFVAEIGVGVVHHHRPAPAVEVDTPTRQLHGRVKHEFDPAGRLNPGIDLLAL
ncbi:MAG: hypothetical protein AAFP84_05635, partial [Actinomycetota bacterium]